MRKFKYGLVALAASAAMIIPAGAATASTQSASTAMNPGQCGAIINICVDVLHNGVVIETGDILSRNVVQVCVLDGNLNDNITALNRGDVLTCTNGNTMKKH
jgi:hypothetical protein